jgi:hypothetical protein
MYYQPRFLDTKWEQYKQEQGLIRDDDVDPDGFAAWGFEQLLLHRIPLYDTIARRYGYKVHMEDVPAVTSEAAFIDLLCRVIDNQS